MYKDTVQRCQKLPLHLVKTSSENGSPRTLRAGTLCGEWACRLILSIAVSESMKPLTTLPSRLLLYRIKIGEEQIELNLSEDQLFVRIIIHLAHTNIGYHPKQRHCHKENIGQETNRSDKRAYQSQSMQYHRDKLLFAVVDDLL